MSSMLSPRTGAPAGVARAGARRSRILLRARGLSRESLRLFRAASPIALVALLNMALALTDAVMIGRYDPHGLASIVVVSDMQSIVFNFIAGFSAVVAPHAAAAIGAGVRWQVCTIVKRILLMALIAAAAAALAIYHSPAVLHALGVRLRDDAIAVSYAHYMAGAFLFMILFALNRHVLAAVGLSRIAVMAAAAAAPLNALANKVFMEGAFGWAGMGVPGAGLATLLVMALTGGLLTVYLFVSPSLHPFREQTPEAATVHWPEMARLARPGLLMGLGAVAETGVFLASTICVGLFAADALMAHTLAFRAMALSYLLLAGLGQAITIRVAYLGAGVSRRREARAHRAALVCCAMLIALLLALFCLASADVTLVAALMVPDIDAHSLAQTRAIVPLAGAALAAAVPAHVACAILRAKGRALAALAILTAGHWGIGLPAMLLLAWSGAGVSGVWTGLLLGALAASMFALAAGLHAPTVARGARATPALSSA